VTLGPKSIIGLAVLIPVVALLIAFMVDGLGTFNLFVPKDATSHRVASGIAYGAGPRHSLDIYAPTTPRKNLPVIVFFYGGSWKGGYRQGYEFAGRALAAQGFVVVVPDYRILPEVHYPAFLKDCADAVQWTQAHIAEYEGDPAQIVLAGHSAGAYNAVEIALDPQWLGDNRHALKGVVGIAGPYDFLPLDIPATKAAFGQWPKLEETQPVNHVSADAPPLLLLYGDADTLVKRRNAVNLHAKLNAVGGHATLITYPGVDHIGIMTALSTFYRRKVPVLADLATFAHKVTQK
jgi:acetyl esterase/lipase